MLNPNLCLNYLPLVNENGENHGGYYNDVLARNDDAKNASVLENAINDMMHDIEKTKIKRNDWARLTNGKVNIVSRFIMEHTSKADERLIESANILNEANNRVNKDVKICVDSKDIIGLKHIFADCLDADPTFDESVNDYNYVKKNAPWLFEDYKEMTPLSNNPKDWNKEYWSKIKFDLENNFCDKRFMHMVKVAKVVYKDKIERLYNERSKRTAEQPQDGDIYTKERVIKRYSKTASGETIEELKKRLEEENRKRDESDENNKKFSGFPKRDAIIHALDGTRARRMLIERLLADPSMSNKDIRSDYEYAKKHIKDLFEPHEDMTPLNTKADRWNREYLDKLLLDLKQNFSKKRAEHVIRVAEYIDYNDSASKHTKPDSTTKISKLVSDLLHDLVELIKSLGSRDFTYIKYKWKNLCDNFKNNAKNTALGKKISAILSKTPNTTKEAKEQIDNINDTIKGSKSEDLNESVYSTTLDEKIEGYDDMVRNAIDVPYREVESNNNSSSKPKNKTNTVKLGKLVSDFVSDLLDLLKGLGSKNFSTIKNRWKVLCDNFVRNVRNTALGQAITKIFKKTPDTKSEAKDQVNQLNNLLTEAKNKNMNEASFRNDKGETVPKKCTKCGGDVKLYIKGEPVYLCNECNTYYGTKPVNENILDTPVEISDTYEFNKCAKYIDALHLAVSAIYRNVSCYKRMINCAKNIADSLLSSDMAPSDIKTASINYDDKCCNIYSDIRAGILNDQQKFGITESELNSCHMSIAIKRMYGGFGNLSALSEADEALCKDRIHRLDLELDKCVDELSTVADMLKCNSDLFNKIDQIRARSMGGYNNTFLDNVVNDLHGMVGEVGMTFDDIKRIKMCVMPVTHNNDLEDSYKVNRSAPMAESVNQRSIYYRLGESETFNLVNQMTSVNGAPMVHNITKMVKEGYGFKHLGLHDLDKTVIYDIFETNQYFTSSPGLKGAIRALLGNGSIQMVYSDSIKIDVSIPYVVMAGKTPRIFVNVSDFLKINPAGKYEYSIVRNKGGLVAIIFAACVSYTILRKYTTLPNDLNVPVALMHANMLTSVIDRLIHMDPVTKDKVKYLCTKYALVQMYGTATGTNIFYNVFRKKYFVQLSPLIMDSIDSQFNEDSFDSLSKLIDALVANYQSMRKLNYKTVWATWYKRYGAACALSIDYIGFHIYTICMLLYESPLINRLVLDPILKQSRGETTLMLMQDMVAKSL